MSELIHKMSISKRTDWLDQLSARHSEMYCSPEATEVRRSYVEKHPTHVMAFKCMDGRLHLPSMTKTPMGIIKPFRNLGGEFDLGWPYLGELVAGALEKATGKGQKVLALITYHFSRGERHRGCAGFNYDCDAALKSAFSFRDQFERVFGAGSSEVFPIVVGVETDEDALIFHSGEGTGLSLSEFSSSVKGSDNASIEGNLAHALKRIYSNMPEGILRDLMPLALGNLEHIREIRELPRSLDIYHHEWVICIGHGFDFLHKPNTALIIGPYSPNIGEPIAKAARIIMSNMESGRIPDDGMILLASSPYNEAGIDYLRAVEKARFLSHFAAETIRKEVPYIYERMLRRTCVLDWSNRKLKDVGDGATGTF